MARLLATVWQLTFTLLLLFLLGYLYFLFCGYWLRAGLYLAYCAVDCWTLWSLGQQLEMQRVLDEVKRIEREVWAFLLRLPPMQVIVVSELIYERGPIDVTVDVDRLRPP